MSYFYCIKKNGNNRELNCLKEAVMKNLVVNWHITEKCNYHCKFCFAKWNRQNEIWDNLDNAKSVLDNLYSYWKSDYRLNFVGGEPLLFSSKIIPVMEYAITLGMNISVQTNGTNLELLKPVIKSISQIGVSIDSWNHERNISIGRCCGNKSLSKEELKSKLDLLRDAGGTFKLKINTVISEWNWDDIVIPQMQELDCNRIKILKQMPFGNSKGITQEQFYFFLRNNYCKSLPIYIEDNDLMTESYLMISPNGKLFQNGSFNEYTYSESLLMTDFLDALKQISFDIDKFQARYVSDRTNQIIQEAFSRNKTA